MSDEPAADQPAAPRPKSSRLRHRLAHWLGELITVFVGVYAAFFLNYRASHRQENSRRVQLLRWVDERYSEALSNARGQLPVLRDVITDFNTKVAAGQMPEIKPIGWVGDYDAADGIGLLQSGGYELLDIETIRDIQNTESSLRRLTSIASHAQHHSDEMILPNRGKGPTVFYDPDTHRLRESYEWVPVAFDDLKKGFEELEADCTKLLAHVHAERERGR